MGLEGGPDRAGGSSAEPAYGCGEAYPQSVWAAQTPVGDTEHPGRHALLGELGGQGLEGCWFLLEAGEERLAVAREYDDAHPGDRILTHEVVSIEDFGTPSGWRTAQRGSCDPQRALDGLVSADVWLDGTPEPHASSVALLVRERACASGESAQGRTRLVNLEERADAVTIIVGVTPLDGGQECPGNPATPMVIDLAQPLGSRPVIDDSVYPPRSLEPAPQGLHQE